MNITYLFHRIAQVTIENPGLPTPDTNQATILRGLQVVWAIAGGVALIMITIGALQYVISKGEPQSISKAKNTIIYALVGLVICIAAFSIVTFVLGRV